MTELRGCILCEGWNAATKKCTYSGFEPTTTLTRCKKEYIIHGNRCEHCGSADVTIKETTNQNEVHYFCSIDHALKAKEVEA